MLHNKVLKKQCRWCCAEDVWRSSPQSFPQLRLRQPRLPLRSLPPHHLPSVMKDFLTRVGCCVPGHNWSGCSCNAAPFRTRTTTLAGHDQGNGDLRQFATCTRPTHPGDIEPSGHRVDQNIGHELLPGRHTRILENRRPQFSAPGSESNRVVFLITALRTPSIFFRFLRFDVGGRLRRRFKRRSLPNHCAEGPGLSL